MSKKEPKCHKLHEDLYKAAGTVGQISKQSRELNYNFSAAVATSRSASQENVEESYLLLILVLKKRLISYCQKFSILTSQTVRSNQPYEQTTKFVLVTKPARLSGATHRNFYERKNGEARSPKLRLFFQLSIVIRVA